MHLDPWIRCLVDTQGPMLPVLSPLLVSLASAVTVVADSPRVEASELSRAVELRCGAKEPNVLATVADVPGDGFSLVMIDMETTWLDSWQLDGEGYEEADRTRALSMVICGRVADREAEKLAEAQSTAVLEPVAPPRPPEAVRIRPFVSSTLLLDRPTVGAHVDLCLERWCPEFGYAVAARPWAAIGRADLLPMPQWTLDMGLGRTLGDPFAAGISGYLESEFNNPASTHLGTALWGELNRNKALGLRGTLRTARALIWTDDPDGTGIVALERNKVLLTVAATWRGMR